MTDTLNGGDSADDNALFESIVNPDPAPAPQPEPEREAPAPEPQPSPGQPAAELPNSEKPAEPEPSIPPARLREEAEARRRMERENTELRARLAALEAVRQPAAAQPQEQPDPFAEMLADPKAFVGKALSPVQQEMQRQRIETSMLMAQDKYGEDVVRDADNALGELSKANRAEAEMVAKRILGSPHPGRALVEWHKQQNVLREVGTDPAAYEQKLREKFLKDPEFVKQALEQARSSAQPVTSAPQSAASSFPTLSNIGAPAGGGSAAPQSDAELFASTVRRK